MPNIDATVGGVNSNSYATLQEAETYFDAKLGVSEWTGAVQADKERALLGATRRLEQERYKGIRATSTQQLQWPRWGVILDGIVVIQADEIPQAIKRAQFELALAELVGEDALQGFEHLQLGELSLSPVLEDEEALPELVERELKDLLDPSRSGVMAPIHRG